MGVQLGIIGVGNMGRAILDAALNNGTVRPEQVLLYNRTRQKLLPYEAKGIRIAKTAGEALAEARYCLIAVEPQNLAGLLAEIKGDYRASTVIISIVAGASSAYYRSVLGVDCRLVMAMPNTPIQIGRGATVVAPVDPVEKEDAAFVSSLFSRAGVVAQLGEEQINDAIPVNGSSPAFLYYFAKLFVEEARERGLKEQQAVELFSQAMIGAGELMRDSGLSLQQLIDRVTSPGGATLAGLRAFEENGLPLAVKAAYAACSSRAEELGRGLYAEKE